MTLLASRSTSHCNHHHQIITIVIIIINASPKLCLLPITQNPMLGWSSLRCLSRTECQLHLQPGGQERSTKGEEGPSARAGHKIGRAAMVSIAAKADLSE